MKFILIVAYLLSYITLLGGNKNEFDHFINVKINKLKGEVFHNQENDTLIILGSVIIPDRFAKSFTMCEFIIPDSSAEVKFFIQTFDDSDNLIDELQVPLIKHVRVKSGYHLQGLLPLDESSNLVRYVLRIDDNKLLPKSFHYKIITKASVFPIKSIVYISVIWIFSLLMIYLLAWPRFCKLAKLRWNKYFFKALSAFSYFFIAVLFFDEIGLLLKEWGVYSRLFATTRDFMSITGISHLLFFANLGIMVPATYSLAGQSLIRLKNGEFKTSMSGWYRFPDFVRRYSLFVAIFMLICTLLFFVIQCWVWREFGHEEVLFKDFSYLGVLVLLFVIAPLVVVLFKILHVQYRIQQEDNPNQYNVWWNRYNFFFVLTVFFLSLTQTMITRVILLIGLLNWGKKVYKKLIILINKKYKTDKLISGFESNLGLLNSISLFDKWNFLLLTTSTFILLLIFQTTASPYPPTENAFPKTETISFFYMSFILLFLIPVKKKKWLKSVLWSLYVFFCLYGLPSVFPSWFFPSNQDPGFSTFESLILLTNKAYTIFLLASLHLFIISVFMYNLIRENIKQKILMGNSHTLFELRLFVLGYFLIFPIFFMYLFPNFFFAVASTDMYQFAGIMPWFNLNKLIAISICIVSVSFLPLLLMSEKNASQLKNEVLTIGGEELVTKIKEKVKFVCKFKSWNPQRGYKHLAYYAGVIIIFCLIMLFSLKAPQLFTPRNLKLNWAISLNLDQGEYIRFISQQNNLLVIGYNKKIVAVNKSDGSVVWEKPCSVDQAFVTKYSNVVTFGQDTIKMFDFSVDNEVLWQVKVDFGDDFKNPGIYVSQNEIAFSANNRIQVLNIKSGATIGIFEDIKLTRHNVEGLLTGLTTDNKVVIMDVIGEWQEIYCVQDSVENVYSSQGEIFIQTNKEFLCVDLNGHVRWKFAHPEMERIFISSVIVAEEFVLISYAGFGIMAININSGVIEWQKEGFFSIRSYRNYFHYTSNSLFLTINTPVLSRDYKYLYSIDPKNGNILYRYSYQIKSNNFETIGTMQVDNFIINFYGPVLCIYDIRAEDPIFKAMYFKNLNALNAMNFTNVDDFYRNYPVWACLNENSICILNQNGIFTYEIKK